MVRMLVLVEGPTERNFGQRILAPHLGNLNIAMHPRVIGPSGHKGGAGPWERAKKEIVNLIRQEPGSIVTTMFDLYGLPSSWPGRAEVLHKGLKNSDAVALIESKIAEAIEGALAAAGDGFRFIPYLSQHEFEALLFSDPDVLAEVIQGPQHAEKFKAILSECGECEKINDHPDTAPSRRIGNIAHKYSKTVDGIAAAERIGLKTLREKCPHFNTWLLRLESFREPS